MAAMPMSIHVISRLSYFCDILRTNTEETDQIKTANREKRIPAGLSAEPDPRMAYTPSSETRIPPVLYLVSFSLRITAPARVMATGFSALISEAIEAPASFVPMS